MIKGIQAGRLPNIDQTFTYDGAGRLTASTGPWGAGTFTYDAIGNLVQRQVGTRTVAMTYNATSNRLTSHTDTVGGPRSLSYDARGNVTALGGLGFTYDASNQPVAVNGTAAGTFAYDGHLRRAKQIVGGVTRYSVYDVSGGLVSIDQVGAGPTEYIRASGMVLARVAGAAVTWLHPDHLGSAVAGTGSTGSVVWRESEQPFGEDWISAPANDNQAGYTGHIEDAATGLVYMQARYYDPVIGRFLANDPVGFSPQRPDMFNRYAYAGNDPVNWIDAFGTERIYAPNRTNLTYRRSQIYQKFHSSLLDGQAKHPTYFFAAAANTTGWAALGGGEAVGFIPLARWGNPMSGWSATLANYLGGYLYANVNKPLYEALYDGAKLPSVLHGLSGQALDHAIVSLEQSIVQSFLNSLPEEQRKKFTSESNAAIRLTTNETVRAVIESYGGEFDFGNQSHREAVGTALTDAARDKHEGCKVTTGSRVCK